jgi:hypothetical protein
MEWITNISQALTLLGFGNMTLVSIILVVLCPISFVYASGRGLNILQTKLQKNTFAIIIIIALSVLETFNIIPKIIQSLLFLISLGFFFYVVLWQKFYDRADKKLDKIIGEDEEKNGNGFTVKKRAHKK